MTALVLTPPVPGAFTALPLVDQAYRTWESHLERGLTTLRDKGELAPDADPARLAQAAMTSVQGGLLLAHIRLGRWRRRTARALAATLTVVLFAAPAIAVVVALVHVL